MGRGPGFGAMAAGDRAAAKELQYELNMTNRLVKSAQQVGPQQQSAVVVRRVQYELLTTNHCAPTKYYLPTYYLLLTTYYLPPT